MGRISLLRHQSFDLLHHLLYNGPLIVPQIVSAIEEDLELQEGEVHFLALACGLLGLEEKLCGAGGVHRDGVKN